MRVSTTGNLPRSTAAQPQSPPWALFASGAVTLAWAGVLGRLWLAHAWVVDAAGRPIVTDFIAQWSAGRLALRGLALSAYDGRLQHAGEVAVLGHGFAGYYGWPYPPLFLLPAAALAALPYGVAFLGWMAATLGVLGATVATIARRREAVVFLLATPWTLADLVIGQNGFLTAALIGLVLLHLDRRPILAGVLLGLLTYKPHFGLLFPLALAADQRWRAMAFAAVSAILANLVAGLLFGTATLTAFLQGLPSTAHSLVVEGAVGWSKLQSVYGLARWLGAPDALAWAAQGLVGLACAAGMVLLWRGRAAYDLKAAALAAGAVLVTPYLFTYDQPVLIVALAFLYRHRPFDRFEQIVATLAALCPIAFLTFDLPAGLFASLGVAALVARRVVAAVAAPDPCLTPAAQPA